MPKSARKPVGGVKPTPGSSRSGKRPAKAPASSASKRAPRSRDDGGASAALTMPPPSTKSARKRKVCSALYLYLCS